MIQTLFFSRVESPRALRRGGVSESKQLKRHGVSFFAWNGRDSVTDFFRHPDLSQTNQYNLHDIISKTFILKRGLYVCADDSIYEVYLIFIDDRNVVLCERSIPKYFLLLLIILADKIHIIIINSKLLSVMLYG